MKLSELIDIAEFHIPVIEFYNEYNELEYLVDLNKVEFDDIDIVYSDDNLPFGIIKLKRKYDEEGELNGKVL
tara:strand:+ start:485 stop:700 length:216 start_codon:yes stop_codon:yes gene_type:complete